VVTCRECQLAVNETATLDGGGAEGGGAAEVLLVLRICSGPLNTSSSHQAASTPGHGGFERRPTLDFRHEPRQVGR
jgi:hypothetical protein